MLISKKWLSQYIDLSDTDFSVVGDLITSAGLEVEGYEKLSEGNNLVIGYVESCIDHPDSDHLHVCQVNLGETVEQIVCGAPNVAAGQKVIVACVGAKLKDGEIKAGVIRGQQSNGMICSLLELGVDEKYLSEESKTGIEVLPEDAPVGHNDPLAYLGFDDEILDIGLTPNRNDCLAAWSMAKETGAILNKEVKLPECDGYANQGSETTLKVSSTTEKCPLFLGKVINSVTIKPSPEWMKQLLMAAGIKSINNVVDISNIVMLETGQPLHFYDLEAIPAKEITVKADIASTYTALDGEEYDINEGDIMITTEGTPIGIAGIMGGDDSKIKDTTKGIIIEAASFNHVSIRNTSRRLNLSTDASVHFQKGIEPMAPFKAMDRAVQLLVEYADATGLEATAQYGENTYQPLSFEVSLTSMNTLLGTDFNMEEVLDVLTCLDLNPQANGDAITVTIPSYRTDLCIEEDIAEEVIRIIGYDRLPSTMPLLPATVGALSKRQALRRKIKTTLNNLGFNEAITYTLVSDKEISDGVMPLANPYVLASPMSEERKNIRSSITPSLLESVAYNQARSIKDVALFEISNVYGKDIVEERLCVMASGNLQKNRWQKFAIASDFYMMKGLLQSLLSTLGFDAKRVSFKENTKDTEHFHPYKSACVYLGKDLLGMIGHIHPRMAKAYGTTDTVMMEISLELLLNSKASKIKFTPISKYPQVSRDLAFVVEENVKVADIVKCIEQNGKVNKENIIKNVEVFDIYTGEHMEPGFKSIALSITFQSDTKTLQDKEINEVHENILAALAKQVNAQLRG